MTACSNTWQEFQERYAAYRAMPVWGTMVRIPNAHGELDPVHRIAIAERGKRAVDRVRKMIKKFESRAQTSWPPSPRTFVNDTAALDRLCAEVRPGADNFRNFWDALVFDRDGYTCRYCGRDAFEFFLQTGERRTLWLVVDHLDASGKRPGCYELANSVTACWTCNTLKSALPEPLFLQELDSLVEARLRLKQKVVPNQPLEAAP